MGYFYFPLKTNLQNNIPFGREHHDFCHQVGSPVRVQIRRPNEPKAFGWGLLQGAPKGARNLSFTKGFFAQIMPRNYLKFMLTPSLHNHVECQIDISHNNAILFIQYLFSRFEICPITPSHLPLGTPLHNVI